MFDEYDDDDDDDDVFVTLGKSTMIYNSVTYRVSPTRRREDWVRVFCGRGYVVIIPYVTS